MDQASRGTASHRCRGFTVVELLSVLAVVALLGTMVATATVGAQRRARRAVCANNLRQLGFGLNSFVGSYGEYPLGMNKGFSDGKNPAHSTSWQVSLQTAMNSGAPRVNSSTWIFKGVWDCPSARKPESFAESHGYTEYGYNGDGLGVEVEGVSLGLGGHFIPRAPSSAPPVKEGEVLNPSEMMAVGDGFSGWNGVIQDGLWAMLRNAGVEEEMGSTKRSSQRHQGKANIVFCDGHVDALSLQTLFSDTSDAALRLWNRDNKPHRERLIAQP